MEDRLGTPSQTAWSESAARSWDFALAYVADAAFLSLLVGLVRSFARWISGALPLEYLLHSVAVNAALAFGLAVAAFPLLLLFCRRRTSMWAAAAASVVGVYGPFWLLSSAVRFRALLRGEAQPILGEALHWFPGLLGLALIAWALFSSGPLRTVLRRGLLGSVALACIALGLGVFSRVTDPATVQALAPGPSARSRPDVLLVLVDTLRADHLSAYGYGLPTSPAVDRMASEAESFTRAFAPAPWTRPSCGALLTSRYPREIGLSDMWSPLPKEIPILPQLLQAEGYATAGIVSSVQLSPPFGFAKGFDVLDIGTSYLRWTGATQALGRLGVISRSEYYPRYDARQLTDRAIEWLERQPRDRPVFMYLHYSDPHEPYQPPPLDDRWREFASDQALRLETPPSGPPTDGRTFSTAEREAVIARYDAEIAFFDAQFGRLLDHLKTRGRYEETLLILTADHGEEFQEHGGWLHAHTLYNELLHVPLIIKYPRRLAGVNGRVTEQPASLIDVVPTIREVLGAAWPLSAFRGESLLGREVAPGGQTRAVYADNGSPPLRALLWGPDKLIQRLDEHGNVVGEEHYSLPRDFGEHAAPAPSEIDRQRLEEMRRQLIEIYERGAPAKQVTVDDETYQELRALGYVN
jgi:arylsulfatase A-like enzyme